MQARTMLHRPPSRLRRVRQLVADRSHAADGDNRRLDMVADHPVIMRCTGDAANEAARGAGPIAAFGMSSWMRSPEAARALSRCRWSMPPSSERTIVQLAERGSRAQRARPLARRVLDKDQRAHQRRRPADRARLHTGASPRCHRLPGVDGGSRLRS